MKKFYEAPRLTNHGNVQAITAANASSNDRDFINGTVLGSIPGPGGSIDACVSKNQKDCD